MLVLKSTLASSFVIVSHNTWSFIFSPGNTRCRLLFLLLWNLMIVSQRSASRLQEHGSTEDLFLLQNRLWHLTKQYSKIHRLRESTLPAHKAINITQFWLKFSCANDNKNNKRKQVKKYVTNCDIGWCLVQKHVIISSLPLIPQKNYLDKIKLKAMKLPYCPPYSQ